MSPGATVLIPRVAQASRNAASSVPQATVMPPSWSSGAYLGSGSLQRITTSFARSRGMVSCRPQ